MKKNFTLNASLLLLLGILLLFTPLTAYGECVTLSGSNINKQNYSRWSSAANSCLIGSSDGNYMSLINNNNENSYLIQYISPSSGTIVKTINVAKELPIFGAFVESNDGYFIISGQNNPDENNSLEVFRITKYTKNWQRVSSCGLYGANTTVPFDCGGARVAVSGSTLYIRSNHEMYRSSDGYNHQANVTIQVDGASNTIISSYTSVMNPSYAGYCSHSFNQFVKVDGNTLLAVDHGDAVPRSVALFKWRSSLSSTFKVTSATNYVDMLEIDGTPGNNATGVSVGGFEFSSSKYIVVGNSVSMDGSENFNGVRNIFVSTIDKSFSSEPNVSFITNYTNSEDSPSTPHFVKLSDDSFMLLWTSGNKLYYCKLNESGELSGSIASADASLSDCAPAFVNGKIVWTAYDSNELYIYSINSSSMILSSNTIKLGHNLIFTPQNDNLVVSCTNCTYSFDCSNWTGGTIFWRSYKSTSSWYSSAYAKNVEIGDGYRLLVSAASSINCISSDSSVAKASENNISFVGNGTVDIYIILDDENGNHFYRKVTFQVGSSSSCNHQIVSKVTPASTTKDGSIAKVCSLCNKTISTSIINKIDKINLSQNTYTYSGSYHKPSVSIYDSQGKKISSDYYNLTYSNNQNVGNATVKVSFKGNYYGNTSKTFTINPGKTSITKITANKKKKGFDVVIKAQKNQTSGYVISYSKNKNFKNAKEVNVTKNTKTKVTVSKLSSKTKYYVRVKTYKKVDGKKYYSSWSKTKTIKTK